MTATLDATKTTQTYAIDKMHSDVTFQAPTTWRAR